MRMPHHHRGIHPESGADQYQRSRILTSGRMSSHLMLCEKALNLMNDEAHFGADAQRQARNIISQLQKALNIQHQPAQEFYKSLAVVWDVLGEANVEDFRRGRDIFLQYYLTLRTVAGLESEATESVSRSR